ncbi:MAG: SAM-dependent methyltransferase [Ignavibacteriae bacterium]|nr:SAM-dependent methyltransferase [Ignavibacteriota bacterium]|tara:strand:- start:341 stop:1258 length:918 start_codon:yes stop_codon:yes gene_type:complete
MIHEPVLLKESIEYLVINKSGFYFDGTIGFGGHSEKILDQLNENALLLGSDKDKEAYNYCRTKFENDFRVKLFHGSYKYLDIFSKIEFIDGFDGIFADLGVSSYQLDDKDAGFTFRQDSVLDLRMNKDEGEPAYFYLNTLEEKEIADLIFNLGEERSSRKIARRIVEKRKEKEFKTSNDLKEVIAEFVPSHKLSKTLSRVFQALRIYVNNELEDLEIFLDKAVKLLKPGGRIVILTYHSLEDRIVKDKFKYETLDCICPPESPICTCDKESTLKLVTRKPVTPSAEEIQRNRRSRSAKLRAAEKL